MHNVQNENQPASQEPKNKVRMALQEENCHGEKRVSEIDRRLYNRLQYSSAASSFCSGATYLTERDRQSGSVSTRHIGSTFQDCWGVGS